MADVISFGNDVDTSGPSAMLRTIFRYIRRHAGANDELIALAAQEELFDAQGGWFFDTLSLSAFEQLQEILDRLQAELPEAIANWNEPFRPRFYVNFEKFRNKLAERIEQLRA